MSKNKSKEIKYQYPSRFGSHKSMVVNNGIKIEDDRFVYCKDEYGEYLTERARLDNNLADPHRCRTGRLTALFQGKKEK